MEEVILVNGTRVWLDWTDNNEMVAWTDVRPRKKIGTFSFAEKEDPRGQTYYKLTHAHLESTGKKGEFTQKGLGREILKRAPQPIVVSRDDGQTNDDGSHLTGDAPGFIAKMVAEGLLAWETPDD